VISIEVKNQKFMIMEEEEEEDIFLIDK